MRYTLKGKIKRYFEIRFIGLNHMSEDIIEAITDKPERFSKNNISYHVETVHGMTSAQTYYVLWRGDKHILKYGIRDENLIISFFAGTDELIYRTWKELV